MRFDIERVDFVSVRDLAFATGMQDTNVYKRLRELGLNHVKHNGQACVTAEGSRLFTVAAELNTVSRMNYQSMSKCDVNMLEYILKTVEGK